MPSFHPLILIPVYNHERGLATMLDGLRASGLPCLLVDDGSEPGCAAALAEMARTHADWLREQVRLLLERGFGQSTRRTLASAS